MISWDAQNIYNEWRTIMIVTTSQNIEGKFATEYLGIVSGALVMALPGGNKAVQRGWQTAVEGVVAILVEQATRLGADSVIAVRFESVGGHLCGTGTAVKLE